MIDLGDKVRDVVSGFVGVVLAKKIGLFEADECRVHAQDEGELEGHWIEDGRLIVIQKHAVIGFKAQAGMPAMMLEPVEQSNRIKAHRKSGGEVPVQ